MDYVDHTFFAFPRSIDMPLATLATEEQDTPIFDLLAICNQSKKPFSDHIVGWNRTLEVEGEMMGDGRDE